MQAHTQYSIHVNPVPISSKLEAYLSKWRVSTTCFPSICPKDKGSSLIIVLASDWSRSMTVTLVQLSLCQLLRVLCSSIKLEMLSQCGCLNSQAVIDRRPWLTTICKKVCKKRQAEKDMIMPWLRDLGVLWYPVWLMMLQLLFSVSCFD